jgi:hypothetical protein
MKKILCRLAYSVCVVVAFPFGASAAAIYLNQSSDPGNVLRLNADGSGLTTIISGSNPYSAGRAIDVNPSLGILYYSRISSAQG